MMYQPKILKCGPLATYIPNAQVPVPFLRVSKVSDSMIKDSVTIPYYNIVRRTNHYFDDG